MSITDEQKQLQSDDVAGIDELGQIFQKLKSELAKIIVGQNEVIERLAICLFARGHALLMGVPGLAKTLLVSKLAETMSLNFSRIQFTPDLMPMDITGTDILQDNRPRADANLNLFMAPSLPTSCWPMKSIALRQDPSRDARGDAGAPSHRVGQTFTTWIHPFFVLATQNPVEQEGTYPLPEAQLDRFMFLIELDYPSESGGDSNCPDHDWRRAARARSR